MGAEELWRRLPPARRVAFAKRVLRAVAQALERAARCSDLACVRRELEPLLERREEVRLSIREAVKPEFRDVVMMVERVVLGG